MKGYYTQEILIQGNDSITGIVRGKRTRGTLIILRDKSMTNVTILATVSPIRYGSGIMEDHIIPI